MASKPPRRIDVTIPRDLESARAKLVYLYVAAADEPTVERLRDDLGIKKGTALLITGTLCKRGHLERTDNGFELT